MAQINMCDRCSSVGLQQAIGTLIYHTGPNSTTIKKELCPTCVGELVTWATESPVRNTGGAAFREEWQPVPELEAAHESPKETRDHGQDTTRQH